MTSLLKKTLISLSLLAFMVSVFVAPVVSYADNDPINMTIQNPIKADSINGFIKNLLEGVIKIGIPLVAIAIIYSGFLYVTAQGNPGAIEKAHKAFLYTVIGAAILLGSWTLAQIITETVKKL